MRNRKRLCVRRWIGLLCVFVATSLFLTPAAEAQDMVILCWGPYDGIQVGLGCAGTGAGCYDCVVIVYSQEECDGDPLCEPPVRPGESSKIADDLRSLTGAGELGSRSRSDMSCSNSLFELVDQRGLPGVRRKEVVPEWESTAP